MVVPVRWWQFGHICGPAWSYLYVGGNLAISVGQQVKLFVMGLQQPRVILQTTAQLYIPRSGNVTEVCREQCTAM